VQTGAYVVHDAEGSIAVRVQKEDAYRWSVIHDLEHDVALAHLDSGSLWLRIREFEGCLTVRSEIEASSTDHRIDAASSLHVLAPMPGLLAAVHVGVGDLIAAGARVVTLESMKLLMDLKSSSAGRVAKLHCVAGTTVGAGSILVSLDALDSTDQVQTPS
jgi:3-methylcrotonyl-CoA carboxylase alpha subunit